jgi:hypothetical protein
MPKVSENQRRWKTWVGVPIRDMLEQAAERLAWAWTCDEKDPTSYPVNTEYAFAEIKEQLRGEVRRRAKLSVPTPPRTLFDLIDERTIKAVYEDQNEGSYEKALQQAAGFRGSRAWRKIWRAIDAAYSIGHYGIDSAPRPKVQFLHRNLLEIVESEQLVGLTLEGIVEFFDDTCPCGKGHKLDTIRKLIQRRARVLRSKS